MTCYVSQHNLTTAYGKPFKGKTFVVIHGNGYHIVVIGGFLPYLLMEMVKMAIALTVYTYVFLYFFQLLTFLNVSVSQCIPQYC